MSTITAISTALPINKYSQQELFEFADAVYSKNEFDSRKLKFLYNHSGIYTRYSVIPDFNKPFQDYSFFSPSESLEPITPIEKRMDWFNRESVLLSQSALMDCIDGKIGKNEITHLITVSCTGMCAPGLDLQLMEALDLPKNTMRTSVNFMGCYAAIHAMKIADSFCKSHSNANVIVVCTELCTLHFQKEPTQDNITSSLLFSDGCAAFLMQSQPTSAGIKVNSFYSQLFEEGKDDMSWQIVTSGFQMTLSSHIPVFIKKYFPAVVHQALANIQSTSSDVQHWCIHPGGKKILESIQESIMLPQGALNDSYAVLNDYGNMSSATILFVLKKIMDKQQPVPLIFGAGFGPGLTIETFTASYD